MISQPLNLTLESTAGHRPLPLTIERLIVAGWVGKNKEALRAHIEELGRLGVPAPSRTPTYMNLSAALLTTAEAMEVVGPESSGEVECVLFGSSGKLYVGVGSDHTDRGFEKYDIPASKQMCAKPVAPVVWDIEDVREHLDRITLRSWTTTGGRRRLYQEGLLASNIGIMDIIRGIPAEDRLGLERFALFCGTLPAIGGIDIGEIFEFEMEDPVLDRRIGHRYSIRRLPQYL
ncbi:MAG: DUF2848 domain-containing protein [Desulfobacterales bacterium]|jgi:hypothetical protein|nr:DUF2848 domain-containing protein [Desulfobacterales bacterium]